jgi:hypothetical protein
LASPCWLWLTPTLTHTHLGPREHLCVVVHTLVYGGGLAREGRLRHGHTVAHTVLHKGAPGQGATPPILAN